MQRQILDLLQQVNRDEGAAVVFISHDISAVAELCGRIVVMYAGRIVEEVGVAIGSATGAPPTPTRVRCWPRCPISASTANAP